jgi:peptide/nickel transport system substrate-binding protein
MRLGCPSLARVLRAGYYGIEVSRAALGSYIYNMRRALHYILAIGVATLLVACTRVSTSAGPATAGNAWTHHGILRMGEILDPDNLNPVLGQQQTEVDLSMFWAGYLFNWSDRNEWVPELATQVPTLDNGGISKDGLAITYHLREGVQWQDGAPFGTDDVIFTWQAVMNPNNNVGSRLGYDDITRIDKRDDHTIVVHLRRPYAPFVASFFTMGSTPYPVLPKHLLGGLHDINRAAYNNLPIGTGPFRVAEYRKSTYIKFVANPRYWRGPPKLKVIEYHIIPDDNTILTQLEAHEIDFEYAAPHSQAPTFAKIPGVKMELTEFTSFAMIAFNDQGPILQDVRVRRALAYATDRQAFINKVAHGIPIPADSDQPRFLWAHNPDVMRYPYDPAKAAAQLDAAGWRVGPDGIRSKNGVRLELLATGLAGDVSSRAIFSLLAQQWKAVGVDLSIKNYPSSLLMAAMQVGGIIQSGKYDVSLFSWLNGVDPDDSAFTTCDQWPPQGQNNFRFCDPRVDAQERVALTNYDRPTRKAAYDRIQSLLAEDEPFIVVWFNRRVTVYNTDLKNDKPAHAVTQFWNPWEWEI